MELKVYRKKRNFIKTPEPRGKHGIKKSKKLIYLIQKHSARSLHYDFRIELGGVLLSWAVPKGPCLDPSIKRLAVHVENHPLEYATFEGIIPKGQYGAGTVMLWDKGFWIPEDDHPESSYHKGHLTFTLEASKLKGKWNLVRTNKDKNWLLIKVKDNYARPLKEYDITEEEPDSLISNQSIEEIKVNATAVWSKHGIVKSKKTRTKSKIKKTPILQFDAKKHNLKPSRMPKLIHPQLATLVDKPPIGNNWLHEIKFDGYRIIAFKIRDTTRLVSRNNKDWTDNFKNIAAEISALEIENAIFDGELIVFNNENVSDFQLLQNCIKGRQSSPFFYYIFDLLYYDKYNLMPLPLIKRKEILKKILETKPNHLRYSDHIVDSGKAMFEKSCKLHLEGIISKDSSCPYQEKRTKHWLKIKCMKQQEFVIGGFTPPQKSRQHFGALLLGYFNKKKELVFVGKVGTGFTDASLKSIYNKLIKNKISKCPFNTLPPAYKKSIWVKPTLVTEVAFSKWTKDNYLLHSSFKGLRNDKSAKNIIKEKEDMTEKIVPEAEKIKKPIKLTNPNKILFPEDKINKIQIFEYYDAIAKWILPHIENRPLALVRCPNDFKKCFFQKHINKSTPSSLKGIAIEENHPNEKTIYIDSYDSLMLLPQLGVLEIHPWNCHIDEVESPDMFIFDLDPSPEVHWERVVACAFDIKEQFKKLKLKSFVRTTGGKGLHVVIPITPHYNWEVIENFAQEFVKFMVAQKPKEYVAEMSKAKRKDKIFIDYFRNQRGATSIATYSLRARLHAPVSTPLEWKELTSNYTDSFYTITTLPERLKNLKKDPWATFFTIKQGLPS